jgi:hypothetical protein
VSYRRGGANFGMRKQGMMTGSGEAGGRDGFLGGNDTRSIYFFLKTNLLTLLLNVQYYRYYDQRIIMC